MPWWLLAGCPGLGTGSIDPATVVETPTWEDVGPILVGRCAGCHGATPTAGAPDGFRLDVYGATPDDAGAFDKVERIVARAVDQDPAPMPPGGSVPEADAQTILRWAELGAPETPADLETP